MKANRRRQPPATTSPNTHVSTLLLLLISLGGLHQPAHAQQASADSTNVWLRQQADAEQAVAHIIFTNASQVTLLQKAIDEGERDKTITITNAAEIHRIVGAIRLEYKPSCWCLHQHEITFKTPTGQIQVSFCDHCFDVVAEGKPTLYYKMPPEFMPQVQKILKEHGGSDWYLPGVYRTVSPP